jgi:flagellar hook assembly protein FlgD
LLRDHNDVEAARSQATTTVLVNSIRHDQKATTRTGRLLSPRCVAFVFAAGFLASSPSLGVAAGLDDTVVTASARQLDLGAGGSVTLTTVLPVEATETIVLKDMTGTVVRALVHENRPAGTYRDAWDGLGNGGRRLRDDQYRWVATFESGGDRFTVDRSAELDGDVESQSHPDYKPWDPFNNVALRFTHKFEKPGEILLIFSQATVRVSPSCDAPKYFCRRLDGFWPAGEFAYEWAGVDDSGAFRPDLHAISVLSSHENLSKNAIVVYGGRPSVSRVSVSPAHFRPDLGSQSVSFNLQTYRGERVPAVMTFTNQQSLSALRTLRIPDAAPGLVTTAWDGRADNGARVAPGKYTVTVWVTDSTGQRARGEILTQVDY